MNHFELFGLPLQFQLDGSLLSSTFRDLQRQYHPDNFVSDDAEQLKAVQKASQINDAYRVLKSPLLRAEYLLSLNSVDIRGEQQTLQDPMFLMEQMELREELEAIAESADPEEGLFDFDAKVRKMHKSALNVMQDFLEKSAWEEAADAVRKLKFIEKLAHEVELVEERLLD
jgi:molecular chaperone HscB